MPPVAKVSVKDKPFISGEIDTRLLDGATLHKFAQDLIRGFDPDVYTEIGLKKEVAKRLQSNKIEKFEDFEKALANRMAEARAKVPEEYLALSHDSLVDLTSRAGMRINWEKYDPNTEYRVASRLHTFATKNKYTLDAIRQMEVQVDGRGLRIPILFTDLNNISTATPNGCPQEIIDLMNIYRQKVDPDLQFGRSSGKRPLAVIKLSTLNSAGEKVAVTVQYTLPAEYTLPEKEEGATS